MGKIFCVDFKGTFEIPYKINILPIHLTLLKDVYFIQSWKF